jgi:DNA-binding transcriptional LysR family regulator
MRLAQLRDFVQIVDSGSIRAAARARGVSQPAMTKVLRSLEEELGTHLVERTAHGILLTRSGRAFLSRARAVQSELRKASEELADIAGYGRSVVAIGDSAAGLMLVPRAVARFANENASFHLRIVEGATHALLPLLREHTLDFFLAPKPNGIPANDLRVRPLFRIPLVVACRQAHPLRRARTLRELSDACWILFSAAGWSDSLLGHAFAAARLGEPRAVVQCESYAAAISLLARTDALGIIPRTQMTDSGLCEIPVADAIPELVFTIYMRRDGPLSGPANALARAFVAEGRRLAEASARRRV